jgi:hypothetical protein
VTAQTADRVAAEEWLQRFAGEAGYLYARLLSDTRWAAVAPFLATSGILTGEVGNGWTYDQRWCYRSVTGAAAALEAWDGEGDPEGWHRHLPSNRRVAGPAGAICDGQLVPPGEVYVQP